VVVLDSHPATSTVPLLATGQVNVNGRRREWKAGRKAVDRCRQRRSVRFAGRDKAEWVHDGYQVSGVGCQGVWYFKRERPALADRSRILFDSLRFA
jgi:hypothetical protein